MSVKTFREKDFCYAGILGRREESQIQLQQKKTTLPKLLLSSGQIHQKVPTVFNEMHEQISQFRLDIRAELGDSGNIVILRVR